MKKLIITIVVFLSTLILAQENTNNIKQIEIFMITEGLDPNYYNEVYYQMEAVQNFVYENDVDRWN